MCFGLFMLMLDNTVVNVALPSIQRDLHASLSALEWTSNAYTLSLAVFMITGGRLGDILGRRRLFLFGVITFGISSLIIGFSPDDTVLVAFRAVQGVGAACMMPASLAIITQSFPPNERGTAIGTWAGVSALALAIGPVLGGFLTQDVSWRAIFFINPPIAVIAVIVCLFAAKESRDETVSHRIDYAGILLLTLGLTALVLALIEGNGWGWGSTKTVSMLVASVVLLAAFAITELRVDSPMLDFAFFKSKTSLGVNMVAFIVSFAMFAQFFFMTLYMQNVLGLSPLATGIRFLPSTVVLVILGPISGRLTDKVGPRPLMVVGLLLVAAAIYIDSHITLHSGYGLLLPGFIVMGLGMGLVMSPMSTAAMNAVDRSKAGAASGVLSMSRMVGSTFGVTVMGAIVTTIGKHKLDQSLPNIPDHVRETIAKALGLGAAPAGHQPANVIMAVKEAFVSSVGTGLLVGAIATVIGAITAWLLIQAKVNTAAKAAAPVDDEANEPIAVEAGI